MDIFFCWLQAQLPFRNHHPGRKIENSHLEYYWLSYGPKHEHHRIRKWKPHIITFGFWVLVGIVKTHSFSIISINEIDKFKIMTFWIIVIRTFFFPNCDIFPNKSSRWCAKVMLQFKITRIQCFLLCFRQQLGTRKLWEITSCTYHWNFEIWDFQKFIYMWGGFQKNV